VWNEEEIAGHLCHVYEPAEPSEHGYVIVYLHGVHLGMLHEHPAIVEALGRQGFRIVCPVTGRSWWTDRICAEFDEKLTAERYVVDHVVPWIGQRFAARPPRIGLLGTSMGGQGALRLAFKYPNVFPVVAAISPAIDYHLRWDEGDETLPQMYSDSESARQDTATLHVHPLNWPRNIWFCCDPTDHRWHESTERLRMKLSALGIPHEYDLETEGGGHGFEYYTQMAPAAVRFLTDRLGRERLRVV
jgi:S-formylglutathione hydrolase FrmB